MNEEQQRRFQDYVKDGWVPHYDVRGYVCGWCGHQVSALVGLAAGKKVRSWSDGCYDEGDRKDTDVRICPSCCIATTFDHGKEQLPGPRQGERFQTKGKDEDVQMIVALYNEACSALSQRAASCAVLMFRKILMHVAVQQGAPKNKSFVGYVDYLKNEGVVGKPQHALVERIRQVGNQENHEIVRAAMEETEDLLKLVSHLVRSVYFSV